MQITGGKYNSRKILTPEFDNIKPTLSKTRQGIFNTLSSMTEFYDKVFFDMFSGSGIMSIEALSRGFNVYSFEKDKKTALYIKSVIKNFDENITLYFGDCLKNIAKTPVKADVIFIDPPYSSDLYKKSLNVISEYKKLNENGIIILEHPQDKIIDITDFKIVKTKSYGNKQITYLKKTDD